MKYDLLFEPVKIGPVTAPNRFYQVPHCNTLGHGHPRAEAANRGMKAEGGWGVVCTQEVEIHPSSDISPFVEGRLWDDADIPAHQLTTDAVHKHGALAGIELCYNGHHASNLYSRIAPMSISAMPLDSNEPLQARAMHKRDIANLRQWHVDAALRAKRAGYDIVYVYAGHDMSLLMHSMQTRYNKRTDEYGGSLENRVRLTRETLEAVKEAVGDTCAIAFRFAVDELLGKDGMSCDAEARDVVEMLAEIPDLWDVNISDWSNDSSTARFEPHEGYQEKFTAFVKSMTSKPVVGVGRFTSPDVMLSQVNRGVLDFIGAARPSIADPFLPAKIRAGDLESVRECIGCNICVASDNTISPIRCTQNPTMGQEWKRGWHPEKTKPAKTPVQTLVIGGGPAGLECAWQLSQRGFPVMLAEATDEFGGRALRESKLPGLASYVRVRDYRMQQLNKAKDVQLLPGNTLSAADVIDTGIEHVFIATGSKWHRNGFGTQHPNGVNIDAKAKIYTPDDILDGASPQGRVLVFDDDHYYMGGVIAEKLRADGCDVTLVTPDTMVSSWTENTLEQHKIQKRLMEVGVKLVLSQGLGNLSADHCEIECVYTGAISQIACDAVVLVTSRASDDALMLEIRSNNSSDASADELSSPGFGSDRGHSKGFGFQASNGQTFIAMGDCEAPSTIAAAVYSGHLAAREFDSGVDEYQALFRRELVSLV